jgi:hypothetical protein
VYPLDYIKGRGKPKLITPMNNNSRESVNTDLLCCGTQFLRYDVKL